MEEATQRVRPRAGCLMLVLPIAFTAVIVAAYGVLGVLGYVGRPASGPVERVWFTGCEAAGPVLLARAERMGLGGPSIERAPEGWVLRAQMPDEAGITSRIPTTLTIPGHVRIVDPATGAGVLDDDAVDTAFPHLQLAGAPVTRLLLTDAATRTLAGLAKAEPTRPLVVEVDGLRLFTADVAQFPANGQIDLDAVADSRDAQLELAAARAIALAEGPLPCPVAVGGREVVP